MDNYYLALVHDELLEAITHVHKAKKYYIQAGATERDLHWFELKAINTLAWVLQVISRNIFDNRIDEVLDAGEK